MALTLDKATLEAALVGYQQQLRQIEAKMHELRQTLGHAPNSRQLEISAKPTAKTRKTRHHMSEEGRARIAAAQRARWAKLKKA
jgi:hypothetical protein